MDWAQRMRDFLDHLAPEVDDLRNDVNAIQTDLTTNHKWVQMTQAAYDALGTKDPNTLYVIVG